MKQQSESLKKGSLSSRANALAQELLEFVDKDRTESDRMFEAYQAKYAAAADDAGRNAAFNEYTQQSIAQFSNTDRIFRQKYAARIAVITGDFRANGLSDGKLNTQEQVGGYHGIMVKDVAVALSVLAIKMADKEKGCLLNGTSDYGHDALYQTRV